MTSTPSLKKTLQLNNQQLQQQFEDGVEIQDILKQRSQTIDGLLQSMWSQQNSGNANDSLSAALVAVGGYGREEMHPASDVDLLILLATEPSAEEEAKLSDFVTQLWDLGLEIGHSVRTLDECVTEATDDLTVITNLIESRFLCGNEDVYHQLKNLISVDKIWNSQDFFKAKIKEQEDRYLRYGDTAYRVEPNLKDGPGGLRDLQMIGWITLREYGIGSLKTLSDAKDNDLLNPKEYESLIEARDFLWKVRFALHQITGRKEDRLLFDHQRDLAHAFGYTNDEHNESIEAFMQSYYKTITQLERLNEILLGLLRQRILLENQAEPISINNFYCNQGGYLDLAQKDLFSKQPHTILEVFHILQTVPNLKGLTPATIRELRRNLHLVDQGFRDNPHNKHMFINIVSANHRVNFVLRRMNRYGVLAAYIPAFGNIVGRMQYDLFHAYTVDDHTLNVVRNIRVLSIEKGAKELPFCHELFKHIEKPMLLVLAGIFHDIAKGRGGSHSELGAVDALEFCRSHALSEEDSQLVSWLVENHLLISSIAQRKDINDPEVIKDFVEVVGTLERLEYLHILTISDIKGTNPTLLTSWKHSLLIELFKNTRKYLQNEVAKTDSNEDIIEREIQSKKQAVLAMIAENGMDQAVSERFWKRFDDDYFVQFSAERLFWHIKEIAENKSLLTTQNTLVEDTEEAIIKIADSSVTKSSVLLIYTRDRYGLFVKITSAIEQQCLNTVGASITSTNDDYDLFTFYLLDNDGKPLSSYDDKQQLLDTIKKNLSQEQPSYNFDHHRMPRQLKHFDTKTSVEFSLNTQHQQTEILINTADGAGILTRIGEVFTQYGINIHNARIATLGEIAEDIFLVTTNSGKPVTSEEKQAELEAALIQKLDS
ncbi:[protein-PII] uridylyltransferase [Cocleimonas sp. KMM 6892]|uniref:[protein-PII] uridylyltransferase n=1 Tax=unclassified Cocleimonas TaxID=2639732 RepID=UPI002DBFF0EF|nr:MULTISPECIES: [protein-PII] uridylyltransferase [unclassified Cocleimonas]MEB8434144.1 [protein-PII] uridylyltransferase [Cocleimonas sp. KMM 6892]MEC4716996.1 [protein-PII] uridylyltransferase [Cocleimonas sp. KMM 6895]MEC4746416.1 [protein-PII] uridylyltransferase [Cocleimonas sp. KMM 6896]